MSFEIYTNKAFMFVKPANPEDKAAQQDPKRFVRTEPGKFTTVPDWVQGDNMYLWGVADGDIKIVQAAPTGTGSPDPAPDAGAGAPADAAAAADDTSTAKGKKTKSDPAPDAGAGA